MKLVTFALVNIVVSRCASTHKAIAQIEKLPPDQQDTIAYRFLEEWKN